VDGRSLQGYKNYQADELLRSTGQYVKLCVERYLRGPQFEQLQQAIVNSELITPTPSSSSATSLPRFPVSKVSGLFLCLAMCVRPCLRNMVLNLPGLQPAECWLINAGYWILVGL